MGQRADATQPAEPPGEAGLAEETPISVLAVTPNLELIERARHLRLLGRGLRADGHHYRLVAGARTANSQIEDDGLLYRFVQLSMGTVLPPIELIAYARAILAELLAEPAQIIQSTSVRTTYAAALAIMAQAICRPRAAEPAVVTTLYPGKAPTLLERDVFQLRMLSDAAVVTEAAEYDLLVQRGFPADRLSHIPIPEAEDDQDKLHAHISSIQQVYTRATERRASKATVLMGYEA
jgi:hypothetical protein